MKKIIINGNLIVLYLSLYLFFSFYLYLNSTISLFFLLARKLTHSFTLSLNLSLFLSFSLSLTHSLTYVFLSKISPSQISEISSFLSMISRVPVFFMVLLLVGVVSNAVLMVLGGFFRFVKSTVKTEEQNECTVNVGEAKAFVQRSNQVKLFPWSCHVWIPQYKICCFCQCLLRHWTRLLFHWT